MFFLTVPLFTAFDPLDQLLTKISLSSPRISRNYISFLFGSIDFSIFGLVLYFLILDLISFCSLLVNNLSSDGGHNSPLQETGSSNILGSGTEGIIGSVDSVNSIIGGNIDFSQLWESVENYIIYFLDYLFEPVLVDYSNEILANQITDLGIILFFLIFYIIILFLFFILNITVYILSDKLLNYFTNEYIKWYI